MIMFIRKITFGLFFFTFDRGKDSEIILYCSSLMFSSFSMVSVMISCSDSLPRNVSYQRNFTVNVVSVTKEPMRKQVRENVNGLASIAGKLLHYNYPERTMWKMPLLFIQQ